MPGTVVNFMKGPISKICFEPQYLIDNAMVWYGWTSKSVVILILTFKNGTK